MGKFIDVQTYDFSELDGNIKLVENDMSGLNAEQQDPKELATAHKWITRRGYILTIVLVVIWPLLSIPAGIFTKDYFAFWVLLSICWGFGAAIVITVLPIAESQDEIDMVIDVVCCKKGEEEEEYVWIYVFFFTMKFRMHAIAFNFEMIISFLFCVKYFSLPKKYRQKIWVLICHFLTLQKL